MIIIKEKTKCSGCQVCKNVCPKGCITMEKDSEGFLYPVISEKDCINCGACEIACPIITPVVNTRIESEISVYAAYSKNEYIRLKSSSGGIFTEIATFVIEQGGIVFGAAFDDEFKVVHKFAENFEDLQMFRGSKYLQSDVGNSYLFVKDFLDHGRLVLFTGTPCQVDGLYSFLKKDYNNLLTQDIICHGVPSPLVWQNYIDYRQKKNGSKIVKVNFRNKQYGWNNYSVAMNFENNSKYICCQRKDLYMQVFLSDLCLRPSCYDCHFKNKVRMSDFTLADFWGIQRVMPEMNDDKGTSLVFVNSPQAHKVFNNIKGKLVYKEAKIDEALNCNTAMVKSVKLPKNREKFMSSLKSDNFNIIAKKYRRKNSIVKRIIGKLKRMIIK